ESSVYRANKDLQANLPSVSNYEATLKDLLARPTIASKEWVYNQFESNTHNNTVAGPGLGAAVVQIDGHDKAIAITADCNSRYVSLYPIIGSQIAAVEAIRSLVANGATPICLTDGLNYGNSNNKEVYWQMEQCIDGISDACRTLDVPVISGNVSMYNQSYGE